MTKAEQTGEAYRDLIRRGYDKLDAITLLSAKFGIKKSGIYNRLRRSGDLPPYQRRRQCIHPQSVGFLAGEEIIARRVDRDPCPRCGVRRDKGCGHRPASHLSNVVFA